MNWKGTSTFLMGKSVTVIGLRYFIGEGAFSVFWFLFFFFLRPFLQLGWVVGTAYPKLHVKLMATVFVIVFTYFMVPGHIRSSCLIISL